MWYVAGDDGEDVDDDAVYFYFSYSYLSLVARAHTTHKEIVLNNT